MLGSKPQAGLEDLREVPMRTIRMLGVTLILAVATMIPAKANVFVGIGFGPVLAPVPYAYAPPSNQSAP